MHIQKKLVSSDESKNIYSDFNLNRRIVLHHGDSLEFLKTLPDNFIKLIVTSPPYNIGKTYEKKVLLDEYLAEQELNINEIVRVLSENGSICWEIGNFVLNEEIFPLDIYFYKIFKDKFDLKLRNRIIWHFEHGLHCQKRFSGRYETILWFTKSDNYTFNLDEIRIPSKYPGKRHYKGPNKGQISGNPLGKNPSDLWKFVIDEWENEIWDIPNVKSNHPEKTIHPCQFPIELVERCVLGLTNEEDYVFDPYCGVGSSLIAGIKHNRKVIGCDKELEYIEIAKQRIQDFFDGKLKMRPLGKKVYTPTGREKIAQRPLEWDLNKVS